MKSPNPGSVEAQAQGCTCPVLNNSRGLRAPWPGWWITEGCPIHDTKTQP